MWNRLIATVCAAFVLASPAWAGDITRGLSIAGGQNAFAALKLERVSDPAAGDGILTVRLSLSQARNLKGYGLTLQYDAAGYEFLEARELEGNLLKAASGRETLFLTSNRTPGELNIGAVKVDGQGAGGEGRLVEVTFKTGSTPLPSDF